MNVSHSGHGEGEWELAWHGRGDGAAYQLPQQQSRNDRAEPSPAEPSRCDPSQAELSLAEARAASCELRSTRHEQRGAHVLAAAEQQMPTIRRLQSHRWRCSRRCCRRRSSSSLLSPAHSGTLSLSLQTALRNLLKFRKSLALEVRKSCPSELWNAST